MDDLQEELTCARIEDENRAVDWLRRQISLECLMDCHSINVRIVDEQLDLVAEEFRIILGIEKFLIALRSVKLKTFADTFSEHIQSWVSFHDFGHCLLHKGLKSREILAICRIKIVRKINANHQTSR